MPWNDERNINKYYDFNYLLVPAHALPKQELEYFASVVGEPFCKEAMVLSLVNSLVIMNDIAYNRDNAIFNSTEPNLDLALSGLRIMNIAGVASEIIQAMTHRPEAHKIYGRLFDFEVSMYRRNAYTEPKRRKA